MRMETNKILTGDCFELIKTLPDNSIDLVITSPPYADILSYGKDVSVKKPSDYVDWILPLFTEIHRVLKPTGSFILNINDKCVNKLRSTFIYELIYRNSKETPLKLYDTYIWHKKNGVPNGSNKRFRNNTEFLFHFVKDQNQLKFYMDRVLQERSEEYDKRLKYDNADDSKIVDGKRVRKKVRYMKNITEGKQDHIYTYREIPTAVRPDNVFRFKTAGASRDNEIRHPAPYHRELPLYFINLLTDEGDVVLDVFNGIGTTSLAAQELNRQYLGFELNPTYADFSRQKLDGENVEKIKIHQYDMDDNYITSYDGITAACEAIGYSTPHNILMCFRGNRKEAGGYQWKLEKPVIKKKKIAQYDLEGNFIKAYDSITHIENELGFDSHNHIEDCLRKGNKTSYGYQWKLFDEN